MKLYLRLVPATIIIAALMAGCMDSAQKVLSVTPLLPDDVLVARLALMEHIHRYENLPSLTGLPRIIFVGRRKWDQDAFTVEDVPADVFNGLHSPTFTIEPASRVKFEPIATEPMYFITHAVNGDRGIRILIDEMKCDQQSATVVTRAVMCSWDGDGREFHVTLSRKDGKWTVVNTEITGPVH